MAARMHILTLFLALSLLFSACSPRALHEAEEVVAQADSLWHNGQMYGIDEGDSATLAQACETLKKHTAVSRQLSEVFPFVPCTSSLCTYVHACYHYGRLLRKKDDPAAAMQVFIDATHSHTRDYHIMGRVYSNMGSICHLAGEFPLSYDMYERSANTFLQDKDTLSYYYSLNDMAFELAEQGKKEETLALLENIDPVMQQNLLSLINLTKAVLCRTIGEYDSSITYINQMQYDGLTTTSGMIIKAQAFDNLGITDSALIYANRVLADTNACYQDRFNAIYIVSHSDSTLCSSEINDFASQREDIRYYEYEPEKDKLSKAVQLLEQDLTREPDWKWLMGIIGTLVVIGSIIGLYVYRKGKQKALLSQKIDILEQTANRIQEKKDELAERYQTERQRIEAEIEEKCVLLKNDDSLTKTLAWNDFEAMCHIVDKQFYLLASKLRNMDALNDTEIRLCVLVLINLNRKQISQMLPYALNGVGKFKYRVAQKFGTNGGYLRYFLIELVLGDTQFLSNK